MQWNPGIILEKEEGIGLVRGQDTHYKNAGPCSCAKHGRWGGRYYLAGGGPRCHDALSALLIRATLVHHAGGSTGSPAPTPVYATIVHPETHDVESA